MGALANSRYEAACQARVKKGATDEQAYAAAGFKKDRANAAHFFGRPAIADRVAELMSRGAERAGITAANVIGELAMIAFSPLGDVIVSTEQKRLALVDIGKHLGLFTDQTSNIHKHYVVSDEPMTEAEWAAAFVTAD